MTLLTIIQDASLEVGLSAPNSVVGNSDSGVSQMLALANRGGKALATRMPWQELITEWTFTTIAQESQGSLESIMPGFNWDVYNTIWNRTTRLKAFGPLYPAEWQFFKAITVGTFPEYRIRDNQLIMTPAPPAGQILAGEYVSRFWCQSATGTGQDRWAADTDVGVLKEDLLTLDLVWRYKRAKGFDYAEELRDCELQVNQAMAANGSNRTIRLDSAIDYPPGGLFVPEGNFG